MDYLRLYDLEKYLLDDVRSSFEDTGRLSAFEFFCIIIWKANRAKSRVAQRLRLQDGEHRDDLDAIVADLTSSLKRTEQGKERMRVLIEKWAFRLPMASAILTVLYPDEFTVYDTRLCDELGNHHAVRNRTRFDDLWSGYEAYVADVRQREPDVPGLRGKDRTLWAKSFEKQLKDDIATLFGKHENDSSRRRDVRYL